MADKPMTFEQWVRDGGDLTSCIREETLLLHATEAANRNTLEARVLATIELPNGQRFQAERVIKLRFKEATDANR